MTLAAVRNPPLPRSRSYSNSAPSRSLHERGYIRVNSLASFGFMTVPIVSIRIWQTVAASLVSREEGSHLQQ